MAQTAQDRSERRPAARRGRRGRLDRETIIEAGLELTGRAGSGHLSVRELGQHLGADPTAIYRHFRSMEDVVAALLDELTARAVASVSAPRHEWQERLRQLASATLREYSAHPAVGMEAIVLTTHGPGESAAIELLLSAFTEAGLAEAEAVRYYALFAQMMMASAAGIARAAASTGTTGAVGSWFDVAPIVDPSAYPHLAAAAPRLAAIQDADLFDSGVEMIVTAARREAARPL